MTPRELSQAVIQRRLGVIRELLDIGHGMGAVTRTRLDEDALTRLALERILTQLVELASDVNGHIAAASGNVTATDYRAAIDAVVQLGVVPGELGQELKSSVGLRNVLVHEYVNVDFDIVAAAAGRALVVYADYTRVVADWLASRP